MVQAARLVRQAVGRLQARPAVAPPQKLMRQPEPQRGVPRQVGELADAQPVRVLAPHAERVTVAETERNRRCEPEGCEAAVDLREIQPLLGLEDFARDSSGVFGIEID